MKSSRGEKLTIQDIADLSGVSKSTVSRYINGKLGMIAEDKKERIQKIIQEVGYRPNALAQGLANQNIKEIGVSIADISNTFSSVMIKGIFDEARKRGYGVNFFNANNNPQEEIAGINNFLNKNIKNFVINTTGGNDDFLKTLTTVNVALVDRHMEMLTYDTVTSNNYESVFQAIHYMLKLGYEKIIFLTAPLNMISTRIERFQAYQDAMKECQQEVILLDTEDPERVVSVVKHYLALPGKTGIFTVNGVTLLNFLKLIKKQGLKYPNDLGVLSFDDWDWMGIIEPEISAIQQDSYGMGVKAAQLLLDKIEMDDSLESKEPELIKIDSTLIIRESL